MLSANTHSLQAWAKHQLEPNLNDWMLEQVQKIITKPQLHFFTSLSLAARKTVTPLKQAPVFQLSQPKLEWEAKAWNSRTLVRAILCLNAYEILGQAMIEEAFSTADLNESIDLYQIIPLFPSNPERTLRALEGLRSSASVVFNAVAHYNPLPLEFDEAAWNQMILKALFIDSALSPIIHLEAHWNRNLSNMLSDYAEERISAKRPVPLELWRCISSTLSDRHQNMIASQWHNENQNIRSALRLCLEPCTLAWAMELKQQSNSAPLSTWEQLCPI